jgi:hypothetical protein
MRKVKNTARASEGCGICDTISGRIRSAICARPSDNNFPNPGTDWDCSSMGQISKAMRERF